MNLDDRKDVLACEVHYKIGIPTSDADLEEKYRTSFKEDVSCWS